MRSRQSDAHQEGFREASPPHWTGPGGGGGLHLENSREHEAHPIETGVSMIKDELWPVARLIPIATGTGVEAQERRAASALLAVISSVPDFGRALFKPLGAPAGRFETFIEVPFKLGGRSIRPDGIVAVTRGGKTWGAIVETKVGAARLDVD